MLDVRLATQHPADGVLARVPGPGLGRDVLENKQLVFTAWTSFVRKQARARQLLVIRDAAEVIKVFVLALVILGGREPDGAGLKETN